MNPRKPVKQGVSRTTHPKQSRKTRTIQFEVGGVDEKYLNELRKRFHHASVEALGFLPSPPATGSKRSTLFSGAPQGDDSKKILLLVVNPTYPEVD